MYSLLLITDDPKERLENFLKKSKLIFWVARDEDKQDFNNYRVNGRPQMYIINRDGIIVCQGHHINQEMIEEVIATNFVTHPEKKESLKVITMAGLSQEKIRYTMVLI